MHRGATRKERGEKKGTATKGEVSVEDGFGVAAAPWRGSATLPRPNLSSPGRAVINYWAVFTWDTLGFIECHSPDLGNKSLDSKQTQWGDALRLLMPGWQLSVEHGSVLTRNEQTSSNEQTTTPWSISETNGHYNMKTNMTADRWLRFTVCYKTFTLKVRARAIMHICASVMLQKRWQFSLWGAHARTEKCADKQWPFFFSCVLSAYTVQKQVTAAAGSLHYVFGKRRKKSIQQK